MPFKPIKKKTEKEQIVKFCVDVSDSSTAYSHYEVAAKAWLKMQIYTSQKISLSLFHIYIYIYCVQYIFTVYVCIVPLQH